MSGLLASWLRSDMTTTCGIVQAKHIGKVVTNTAAAMHAAEEQGQWVIADGCSRWVWPQPTGWLAAMAAATLFCSTVLAGTFDTQQANPPCISRKHDPPWRSLPFQQEFVRAVFWATNDRNSSCAHARTCSSCANLRALTQANWTT